MFLARKMAGNETADLKSNSLFKEKQVALTLLDEGAKVMVLKGKETVSDARTLLALEGRASWYSKFRQKSLCVGRIVTAPHIWTGGQSWMSQCCPNLWTLQELILWNKSFHLLHPHCV